MREAAFRPHPAAGAATVAAFMLAALAWPAAADVTGPATVIDGYTTVVAGEQRSGEKAPIYYRFVLPSDRGFRTEAPTK